MNGFTVNKNRRNNVDIMMAILRIVLTERPRKTHIMYKANLNFAQLKKYLNYLTKKGLIEEVNFEGNRTYRLTVKGREMLKIYSQILEMLD